MPSWFLVLGENTVEVVAPLRDKEHSGILRLEALGSPAEPGYLVAVYRQMSGLLPSDTVDPDSRKRNPSACLSGPSTT